MSRLASNRAVEPSGNAADDPRSVSSAVAAGRPVVIAAGGTGGHVVPALAVADVLAARGVPVIWFGTRAGIEARLVPVAGIDIRWIDVAGLRGKGPLGLLTGPLRLVRAIVQSALLLGRLRPRAVLGMGGFVSGPVGLAAVLLRCPLVLHEQNAVAGLTNRRLARFASRVLAAWPDAFGDAVRAEVIGNPVRGDITARRTAAIGRPGIAGGDEADGPRAPLALLVIGGSRGARALNEIVPAAVAALGVPVAVRHQCGEADAKAVRARYEEIARTGRDGTGDGPAVRVEPFIDDMARAYRDADLVICRSGAMTVTELAALGVASILVPFPHAVDDHQSLNARRLSEAGAALLLPQPILTAERLAAEITRLASDRASLGAMAAAARNCFRAGAAEAVADALLEGGRGASSGANATVRDGSPDRPPHGEGAR